MPRTLYPVCVCSRRRFHKPRRFAEYESLFWCQGNAYYVVKLVRFIWYTPRYRDGINTCAGCREKATLCRDVLKNKKSVMLRRASRFLYLLSIVIYCSDCYCAVGKSVCHNHGCNSVCAHCDNEVNVCIDRYSDNGSGVSCSNLSVQHA